jgi:hypothetical protein
MNYIAIKLHGSLRTVIKQTAIEKLRTATMLIYIQQKTGGIKLGRQSPGRLNFVRWRPIFLGSQYEICFM